jgi:hypothetical protein
MLDASSSELKRGDILLLVDTPDHTTAKHKGIIFGQWLTSINPARKNRGLSKVVHALMWLANGPEGGYYNVAEASGSGSVRTRRLPSGTYRVYKCLNSELAQKAAEIAERWAVSGALGYAKGKAVGSIFHSDSLGKHGKARAIQYAAGAKSGAPNWAVNDGAFCSEFVIACYQAAAIKLNFGSPTGLQGSVLECDAQHCSVRALHDRLVRDNNFGLAGEMDYDS